MITKTHPERIARRLLTTDLPAGVNAAAVVQLVDDGASRAKVYAATEKLVAAAWAGAGREAAAATRPKAVKQAQERLRAVAELEALLGLAPDNAEGTADEPVSAVVSDTEADVESEPADAPAAAHTWGAA